MGAAAFAKTLYDAYKSTNMDERAMQKYSQAFEKEQDAKLLVKKKAEYTDKRLANVAQKKRFVIQNTFPQFVSVYDKIQKIEIDQKNVSNEIIPYNSNDQFVVKDLAISAKKEFTDKELVCGMIFGGIGNLMVKESERNLSAANSQMRAANVAYSQAQSIAEVYDAIVGRADRIAKLIVAMNILFVRSINETEHTIDGSVYAKTNAEVSKLLKEIENIIGNGLSNDFVTVNVFPNEDITWKMLNKGQVLSDEMISSVKREFDYSADDYDCYWDTDDMECYAGTDWRGRTKYKDMYCYRNVGKAFESLGKDLLSACYYARSSLEDRAYEFIESFVKEYNKKLKEVLKNKIQIAERAINNM